jgi:hypothetical protein
MKYKVGDLVLIKACVYKSRPRPRLRLRRRLHPHPHLHLMNTFGIITKVEKHSDIFEKGSTENDNCYIWYSQVEGQEHHFYEDEVIGEVIK